MHVKRWVKFLIAGLWALGSVTNARATIFTSEGFGPNDEIRTTFGSNATVDSAGNSVAIAFNIAQTADCQNLTVDTDTGLPYKATVVLRFIGANNTNDALFGNAID
jgi:hypothetical protein